MEQTRKVIIILFSGEAHSGQHFRNLDFKILRAQNVRKMFKNS